MSSQNFVKCSITKLTQYQSMLSREYADLVSSIDMMERAIRKVSQSWQDDVFASIKAPLQKSDMRLRDELETLKTQVMTRLKVQEKWLHDYKRTVR